LVIIDISNGKTNNQIKGNNMKLYTATGTNLTKNSKGAQILRHILVNGPKTKYECVTEVLGKVGSKKSLRGYYSCYFRGLVDEGILSYNSKTFQYNVTEKGVNTYHNALIRTK